MGMDVYGKAATTEEGKYFRNNCWWWRPLWDFAAEKCPDLIDEELHAACHFNDGAGLDADGAMELGLRLEALVADGSAAAYKAERDAEIAAMPREKCEHCSGTGKRDDEYVKGECNACHGVGTRPPTDTHYPFSVENVSRFAKFLKECGGFEVC